MMTKDHIHIGSFPYEGISFKNNNKKKKTKKKQVDKNVINIRYTIMILFID